MHRSASLLLNACRSSTRKPIQRGVRTSCAVQCSASGDGSGNDLTTNPPKATHSLGTCRECGGVLKPAPTLTRMFMIFFLFALCLYPTRRPTGLGNWYFPNCTSKTVRFLQFSSLLSLSPARAREIHLEIL